MLLVRLRITLESTRSFSTCGMSNLHSCHSLPQPGSPDIAYGYISEVIKLLQVFSKEGENHPAAQGVARTLL